jgi:levansucrase
MFTASASKRKTMSESQTSKIAAAPEFCGSTSYWTETQIAQITNASWPSPAVLGKMDAAPLISSLALWDIWPVQNDAGDLAEIAGGSLWIILSAPRSADPDERHGVARLRLLFLKDSVWMDCGLLLPDGFSPGSREWSGSTRVDLTTKTVTLWFTAAGRRDEKTQDFEQRLFHATGVLDLSGPTPMVGEWSALTQSIVNDGSLYADLARNQGIAGQIKGFRDPYWFRDPADGKGYLLFTGSKPTHTSRSDYDGVIGIASANDSDGVTNFSLLPPLIDADGVVNELERPHIFVHNGLYYLFWSSQRSVFSSVGKACPTGLYGMVSTSLFGPYEPINGSGLVLGNPPSEPRQAYAWQVLPSLDVVSFVDHWGLEGRDIAADAEAKQKQFGGTVAPVIKIALEGAKSRILTGSA